MARLKITEHGAGFCHFPRAYEEEYFYQLTSEKAVQTYHKGIPKIVWRKIRKRNEALDCRVYAMAALKFLNPQMSVIGRKIEKKANGPAPSSPRPRRRRRPRGGW